ncbi:MAG: ABC transporter ATP-binding protein [Anaerolineae bacterium]|jgi:oligopeptide/dipeptide ABC transporter ATP-binding protein
MSEPLLTVERLKKYFSITKGIVLARTIGWVKAVDDISFAIPPGETLGLVGESGCGKTTTAFLVLQLYTPTSGVIRLDGVDINNFEGQERAVYRRSVQAVFQDPYSSLNPRMRVHDIIAEPLVVNTKMTKGDVADRVKEVISQVGLPPESPSLFPHEFSGGQRQRVALARALALAPKLIVLDEPVSGLDVSVKAQVMNLLKDLQQRLGTAFLLVAHNLADVRYMSHCVAVMYLGKIVESAAGEELFTRPLHPYTQALLSAALPSHPGVQRKEIVLSGEVPGPVNVPPGCRFHPRCFKAMERCSEEEPSLEAVHSQHRVACHLYSGAGQ